MASVVTGDAQIYMPMGDLIDFEAERARLGKEKSKVEADIDFVMKKLNNPKFVDKAPEKVVAAEREKAGQAARASRKARGVYRSSGLKIKLR